MADSDDDDRAKAAAVLAESEYALVAPRVEPGQGLRDFVARVNSLKAEASAAGNGFEREFHVRTSRGPPPDAAPSPHLRPPPGGRS